jgi:hypothetical protein
MKCKITRQKSGVEYYQYECKTHDTRWLGGLNSKKPSACHGAAEQGVEATLPNARRLIENVLNKNDVELQE